MPYRKVFKMRIFPNEKQKDFFEKMFGDTRFVRNKIIDERDEADAHGQYMDYEDTAYQLTFWKQNDIYPFLKEADTTALQQTLRDLDFEYQNYYIKNKDHPQYKKKKDKIQSYKTARTGKNIYLKDCFIKLPKAGMVLMENALDIGNEKICSVIVEKKEKEYFAYINIGYIQEEECSFDSYFSI